MTKTYQIKINQGKDAKALDVPQAGSKGQPVTVNAAAGARYQLIDPETGYAPENIRATRQGKDLKISFEGSNTSDLVIQDYYKVSPEGYNGLVGETESGKFYEYIPESAAGMASVPMLADSGQLVGMALGGAEVAPAGAAVGVLAAGLFSPWLLGAGAVAAAAAAGGGSKGAAADTTPPAGQTGALAAVTDSGAKDNITNITKPTIVGKAEAGAAVEVSFRDASGKLTGPYKPTSLDANGNYTLQVPNDLADASVDTKGTQYTPVIKVTDAAGNSSTADGTPFTVDTRAAAVTVLIDADANNDGRITIIENGNSAQKSPLNVTAHFVDPKNVNVGDEVYFQLADGVVQKVTLNPIMVKDGFVRFSFMDAIIDRAVLNVKSWLVDGAQNKSEIANDNATADLAVKVHLESIAGDNMINAAEAITGGVLVKGTATALGSVDLFVGSTEIAKAIQVNADGTWSSQVDGTKFQGGTELTAKLVTKDSAISTDSHAYIYDNVVQVRVTADSSTTKIYTLESKETGGINSVAYKVLTDDMWIPIPSGASVALNSSSSGSPKFLMSDVAGNLYSDYSGSDSVTTVAKYSAINNSINPIDLNISQLLSSANGLSIDNKTLAVKSVNVADGKANMLNIDLLDVLNHGVVDVLNAGLGKSPQFKIDGDSSGDALKLTNNLHGSGGWAAEETVMSNGHAYTHYSGFALGLQVDLLIDQNVKVTIV